MYRDVILADNPTAYWPLDTTTDATGNGHSLTLGTGVSYYEGALPGTESYNGIYTGTTATTTPDAADIKRLVYSVECWIKPSGSTGGYRCFLSKGDGIAAVAGGRNPALFLRPSDMKVHFCQETSTPAASQVYIDSSTLNLVQDAWNHVVGTVSGNGGEQRLYINGVLSDVNSSTPANNVGTGTYSWPSGAVLTTNANPFQIGSSAVVGAMDEVAYYPYVLTADQVAAHFEMGLVSGFKGYQRAVMQEKPIAYYSRTTDARYWYDETHNSATADFNQGDPNSVSGLQTWLNSSAVTSLTDGALVVTPGYADLTWTMGSAGGNQYSYYAITGASVANYTVVAGDTLEYETYVVTSDKITQIGMDLFYSDSTPQRQYTPIPNYNQTPGSWVKTSISIGSNAGKTISTYMILSEGDTTGTHRAYFRRALITNGGVVKVVIWSNMTTTAVALPTSTTGTGLPGSTAGSSLTTNTGVGAVNNLPSTGATQWQALATGGSPLYKASGINGLPYFQQTAALGNGLAWDVDYHATACTVFVVGRMRGTSNARIFSGYRNNWLLGWHNNYENEGYFEGWDYGANNTANGSITPASTVLRTFVARFPNAVSPPQPMMRKDAVLLTPISGSTGQQGPNGLATSGYASATNYSEMSDADVYEVIVYSRVLTDAEVARVNGYLGNKYGTFTAAAGGWQHVNSQTPGPINGETPALLSNYYSTYMALSGDYGVVGDAPRLRTAGPSSVEFWIYPTSNAQRQTIYQKTDYSHEWAINFEVNGSINAYWGDGTNYSYLNTAAGSIPLNVWSHVVVTRHTGWGNTYALSGGEVGGTDVWINGVSSTSAYGTSNNGNAGAFIQAVTGTGSLTLGQGYTGYPFLGRIAEVAVYTKALSSARIRAHYALGIRGGAYPGSGGYGG